MTKQLAKDIRQYAKQNNMTVGNVLKMCEVNSSQLYNWQNGGYEASEETEMRVRGILGVPLITFTKRTVSVQEQAEKHDEDNSYLADCISAIQQSHAFKDSYKLQLIAFIISK